MLVEARGFTRNVNEMISRTDNFNNLGIQIINSFNNNEKIIEFLRDHYQNLDQSSQLMNMSVSKAHSILESSLDNMKVFTLEKITQIHDLVNTEMDKINTEYPEKWKKLDNLKYLEILNTNLKSINDKSIQNTDSLNSTLEKINSNLSKIANSKSLISYSVDYLKKGLNWIKSFHN